MGTGSTSQGLVGVGGVGVNVRGRSKLLEVFLALARASCLVKNVSVITSITFKVVGRLGVGIKVIAGGENFWKHVPSEELSRGLPRSLMLSAEDVSRDTDPSVASHDGG